LRHELKLNLSIVWADKVTLVHVGKGIALALEKLERWSANDLG
jgi:hypothetical protein